MCAFSFFDSSIRRFLTKNRIPLFEEPLNQLRDVSWIINQVANLNYPHVDTCSIWQNQARVNCGITTYEKSLRSASTNSSTSLGITGKERRNARSTLQRRILVSVGDTHVQRRISKEGSGNTLGPVARRVLREGTARPRFSGDGGASER